MPIEPVRIEGLREFQRELKAMDDDLPKAIRFAFNEAADIVVSGARPLIPRRSGRARASVKARSTQRNARVVGGGRRAPYYPWLDFGGRVGLDRNIRRPFIKDGRYIYRTYFRRRDDFTRAMEEGLVDIARQNGIEIG